jgi:hypothetical protein
MPLDLEQKTEFPAFGIVGKEPEVTYLLKTSREHMHQEAANELILRKSHFLAGVVILVVLVPESDGVIGHIRDSTIGDCNTMSVAAEIIDGIAESIEGLLDVRTPVSGVELIHERLPDVGDSEIKAGVRDNELTGRVIVFERIHELTTEHLHRSFDRDEE